MIQSKPRISIVATGGSIAGVGPDRMDFILYPELGEHITIEQSLDRIPEANDIAQISAEDLVSVGSTAIGPEEWLRLAQRINGLLESDDTDGVVVTHGTATLEETAYFLHLTIKSRKPVVVTGGHAAAHRHGHRRRLEPAGRHTGGRQFRRCRAGGADGAEQ